MTYVGSITLAILCASLFSLYGAVALDLALQLSALFAVSLSFDITFPTIGVELAAVANLLLGINLSVTAGVLSVAINFALALSVELALVLGLIVTLQGLLNVMGPSVQVFTWGGTGAALGPAVSSVITTSFADGTPTSANVTAILLAATSSGSIAADAVQGVNLLGGGKNYERGLTTTSISSPGVGVTATATPTIASGVITGISVGTNGSGYNPQSPPSVTISTVQPLEGATNTTPIVVTIPDTTDVLTLTIKGTEGNAAANGQWCVQVLTGTTAALYADGGFAVPSVGNGAWTSGTGTVQGNGAGAAASVVMGGGATAQLKGFFGSLTFAAGLVNAGMLAFSTLLSGTFVLLTALLGNLQVRAKVLGSSSANIDIVPPTIAGNIEPVLGIQANLVANLNVAPPSIKASLSAALSGQIAIIGSLVAQIGIQLGFATENLEVYTYNGPGSGLGPALTSSLSGGWGDGTPSTTPVSAVLFVATAPAAQAAMTILFPGA